MNRLSALDSSFLRVETPTAHTHVGWLATLLLPERSRSLDGAVLAERIAARLQLAPRLRQRPDEHALRRRPASSSAAYS